MICQLVGEVILTAAANWDRETNWIYIDIEIDMMSGYERDEIY